MFFSLPSLDKFSKGPESVLYSCSEYLVTACCQVNDNLFMSMLFPTTVLHLTVLLLITILEKVRVPVSIS